MLVADRANRAEVVRLVRMLRSFDPGLGPPPIGPRLAALFQLAPLLVHAVPFGGRYRSQAEAVARRYG